jgi:ubiquitin C-terminal hydrolase
VAPIYKKKIKNNKTWIFFNDVFAQKISGTSAVTTSEINFSAVLL